MLSSDLISLFSLGSSRSSVTKVSCLGQTPTKHAFDAAFHFDNEQITATEKHFYKHVCIIAVIFSCKQYEKMKKKLHEMVSKALLKAREMMILSDPPLTLKPVNLCYKEICCWQVHNGLLISLFSSRCLLFPVFSWELKLMGCICNSLMPAFPPCYRQIPWLPFSVFKHFARLLQSSWNTNSFEKSCQFL